MHSKCNRTNHALFICVILCTYLGKRKRYCKLFQDCFKFLFLREGLKERMVYIQPNTCTTAIFSRIYFNPSRRITLCPLNSNIAFAYFVAGILQICPCQSRLRPYFCNYHSHKRQICVFRPLASPHESSDYCLHWPQNSLFPGKNAPYSGRLLNSSTNKSSRV